jgi:hypothetical protein
MWKECTKGYLISSTGKVKNSETGKLLKLEKNNKGFLRVTIRRKHLFIHRLVAIAFIPNPFHLPQVRFKTSDRENVTMENLEWATEQYNDTQQTGKHKLRANRKLTSGMVMAIRFNKNMPAKTCAELYNVSLSTIYSIRRCGSIGYIIAE